MSGSLLCNRLTGRFVGLLLLLAAATGPAAAVEPLRLRQTIEIPNVSGRLDHMGVDVAGRRLFVAALENDSVEVLDIRSGRWLRSLGGFSKPQGIFYAADVGKLFVANGTDGTCRTLDSKTLAAIHTAQLSLGADLVDYDRRARQLYVGHGGKDAGEPFGELALIDARSGSTVANIHLDAHPGAVLVSGGDEVFVTLPERAEVLVLDRNTHAVLRTWSLAGGERTVSLALDEHAHRLLVGTRNPALMVVLDSHSGKELARSSTVGTLDGLFFDAGARVAFASGGEGFVDVLRQTSPDHYDSVAHVPTGDNARTSLLVPELHRLFVAVPGSAGHPAEVLEFEVQH